MARTNRLALVAGIICLVTLSAPAQETDWRAAYKEAFYKQARSTMQQVLGSSPEMKGASPEAVAAAADRLARGFSDCHMVALDAYSPELQEAAFNAIKDGGSYADAKLSFETALATEGAAGGEREQTIKTMFDAAMKAGNECVEKVRAAQ